MTDLKQTEQQSQPVAKKSCTACLEVKPVTEFGIQGISRKTGKPYYVSRCYKCLRLAKPKKPKELHLKRGPVKGSKHTKRLTVQVSE